LVIHTCQKKNKVILFSRRLYMNVMPYRRRGGARGKKRRRNSKTTVYSRKGSRSQARQIWKNQSQITALQSKMRDTYTTNYYGMNGHKSDTVYPGYISPLINPAAWDPIFNADPLSSDSSTHCRLSTIDIKGLIQIEAGSSVVQVDLFVLQLQKDTAGVTRQNIGADGGDLVDFTTLGDGKWNRKYYYNTGNAATEGRRGTIMNPKAFKVRAHRSFQLGNFAYSDLGGNEEVTNIKDANKNFHIKLSHPIKLANPLGENLTGQDLSWRSIIVDQIQADKQLFMFMSVNSVEGTQVFIDWNATFRVAEPA